MDAAVLFTPKSNWICKNAYMKLPDAFTYQSWHFAWFVARWWKKNEYFQMEIVCIWLYMHEGIEIMLLKLILLGVHAFLIIYSNSHGCSVQAKNTHCPKKLFCIDPYSLFRLANYFHWGLVFFIVSKCI